MKLVSTCCGAEVKVCGDGLMKYYLCSRCHRPCDANQLQGESLAQRFDRALIMLEESGRRLSDANKELRRLCLADIKQKEEEK